MNLGFELVSEAAKPKRVVEDAPMQQSMRAEQKIKRNPDSGQKKARRAQQRKTADTHHSDEVKEHNPNDLGNEPIGRLPGAPIMESGGDGGGGGWGYHPYPSYGEDSEVSITYVDEHGNRSKTRPESWPHSNQSPPSKSYIPPNTWAASLKEAEMGPKSVQRGSLYILVSPSFVGPKPPNDDTPDWHWLVEDLDAPMSQIEVDGYADTSEAAWTAANDAALEIARSKGQLFASKESTVMNFNRREAEILSAMGKATLAEQHLLAAELAELRSQRQASIQEGRDIDVSAGVIRDHLTPVLTHGLNTTATDWLTDVDEPDIDTEAAVQQARTEASAWFSRTSSYVRADREEFAEQATGKARVVASQFGSAAATAHRAFLDTVSFLHKRAEDATVVDPLPDSAPGQQNDQTAPWTTQMTTGDSQKEAFDAEMDAGVTMERDQHLRQSSLHTAGENSTCQTCHHKVYRDSFDGKWLHEGANENGDHAAVPKHSSLHIADDSPGQVDEDQSGNAESTITDYDTMGNDPGTFDEIINGPLKPTGPVAVPSTRAPNVSGSRKLADIAEEIGGDWEPTDGAAPYLGAMRSLASVEDDIAGIDGRSVVAYFLAHAAPWQGETALRVKAELRSLLDGTSALLADLHTADSQNGEAKSDLKEVEVGDPNDRPMWPWEMPELPHGNSGGAGGAEDAANVGGVPTPGQGVADYPQPGKKADLEAEAGGLDNLGDKKAPPFGKGDGDSDDDEKKESSLLEPDAVRPMAVTHTAGFPLCAAGCNVTVSAGEVLVNTNKGLAHAACMERIAVGTGEPPVQQGASLAPGETGTLDTQGSIVAEGEYHYVKKHGDKWVITQKGTGKVLSTHDSQEKAEASFRAMMQSKHGALEGEGIDTEKLAAFRQRVAANVGS